MPRFDGTGPAGCGGKAGRGMGNCQRNNNSNQPAGTGGQFQGFSRGTGIGRGQGGGRGMGKGCNRGNGGRNPNR